MTALPILFPIDISYGSRGGPGYSTTVVVNSAGLESRNQNWSMPRHVYNAAYGITTQARLENLVSFFHVAAGKANSFYYWDPLDYKSCATTETPDPDDQVIGTGDGTTDDFQVVKNYTQSGYSRSRNIYKLKSGTVRVSVAGTEKTPTTHFTYSTTTGIITFTAGNIPTAGQVIRAGYEFYVHARFDTDEISIAIEEYQSGTANVPIIEIKAAD